MSVLSIFSKLEENVGSKLGESASVESVAELAEKIIRRTAKILTRSVPKRNRRICFQADTNDELQRKASIDM